MEIKKAIVSFWKQVKIKSSDMFTLFKVGVGVKIPTHKLHIKDTTDPLKIEGLQNDTTDPDKYLSIDSSNVVKYRTGAQVLTDIGGTPLTTEEVQDIAGALVATGGTKTGIAVTYQDATGDVDFVIDHDAATNFVAAEHVDWAASGAGTIHTDNYVENVVQTTVSGSSGTVTSIGNLTGDVTSSNRATTIAADAVTYAKMQNVSATNVVLGRDSAGAGIVEEISAANLRTIINVEDGATADQTNVTGTAATVTAGAQPAITSLGVLTQLQVDDVYISGSTVSTAGGNDLTVAAHGDLNLTANGNDINVDTDNFTITSATGIKPSLTLKATVSGNKPSVLEFVKDKGIAGADGDYIADIYYTSDNDAQEQTNFVLIQGIVSDATDGAEEGRYDVRIKNTTSGFPVGSFILEGNGANTDATIGYGSGSVTTIAGSLNIDGSNANLNLNNGADIVLEADNAGGGLASSIAYNSSTGNKIMLGATSDVVVLCNRTLNGTVQIRANAAAGSGGEVTVATFEDDSITAAVPLFINAGGPNVAITCTSSDADCMVRVSDNSTAGTNIIGLVATGDDSIIRNDEGNFKVKMANNATTTLDLDQNGNLDITGNILPGITYVKILPSDFMPDDGGRPAMIDDTSGDRWLESHGTGKLFAFVQIPLGFKATLVDVYGSATSAVTVYEADVNSATVTSKGTGNIGTQINITDVTADATNYIMIELAQASGEKVYGGKMTIAKA
jgi:hypothetical protein